MFRRIALTAAAVFALAGGAAAIPVAAQASTGGSISQPNCWARTARCLVTSPGDQGPGLKYQTQQPALKYQEPPPALKY